MKNISKGTFVFDPKDFCCAGFFISAKNRTRRNPFGLAPSSEPEILIQDLWDGRTTGLMSMYSTNDLSTDKKLFTEQITAYINHYKNAIESSKPYLTPVQKRKLTIHEKKKATSSSSAEKVKALALDLEFYEVLAKTVNPSVANQKPII